MTQFHGLKPPYRVILADPPWWYHNGGTGASKNHYSEMRDHEIIGLPVGELADNPCSLFMWTTMPQMPVALAAMQAWGFKYKTVAFVFVKLTKDMTKYRMQMGIAATRGNAEMCLYGVKGRPKRQDNAVPQIIAEPPRAHSQKPDAQYERIHRLFPDGPRVELFARNAQPRWDVWGLEAPPPGTPGT